MSFDNLMRLLDPRKQKMLEAASKPMAQSIDTCLRALPGTGFALFLFTSDGPELVYVSNANREGMLRVLRKFLEDNPEKPVEPAIIQ